MLDIYEFITWTKEERQAHLDLSTACEYRGTHSSECRALLAVVLNTTVPRGMNIHCCHACHDGACSNWKHLYWGTAAENYEDAVAAGHSFQRKQVGSSNGNYKLPPWRNVNKKKDEWAQAASIYDDFTKNGWSFSSRGRGRMFLVERYGLSVGPARKMTERFRAGWIPFDDPEWLEDFEI